MSGCTAPAGRIRAVIRRRRCEAWAGRIREWQQELRAIYIYFDNDQAAYAVENALSLKRLL